MLWSLIKISKCKKPHIDPCKDHLPRTEVAPHIFSLISTNLIISTSNKSYQLKGITWNHATFVSSKLFFISFNKNHNRNPRKHGLELYMTLRHTRPFWGLQRVTPCLYTNKDSKLSFLVYALFVTWPQCTWISLFRKDQMTTEIISKKLNPFSYNALF